MQLSALLCCLVLFTTTNFGYGYHMKHAGGHQREYIMCARNDGTLHYYKNRPGETGTNCEKDIARAKYTNNINQTGWATFDVEIADSGVADYVQRYAAGFLEGRATRDLIFMHIKNTVDGYCDGAEKYCKKLAEFLLKNLRWMRQQIEENPLDLYWRHVNITLNQLTGLINGIEDDLDGVLADENIVIHPIYIVQLAGDIEDLEIRLKKPHELLRKRIGYGHCSALVKVTDQNRDLLFSHVTWSSYASMLRMQKRYRFKLDFVAGATYTFSGYPGAIPSTDDFILSSSKLAILETTISNYNKHILKYIKPETLLCWIRSQVSTRLASSPTEWATTFARHNSGTYNNQWVIVDYKRFLPGSYKLAKGLIHIIEQLPFFPDVYNDSATADFAKKYGDWFKYDKTPRALIFKRDHDQVIDMDSMSRLMRSNNYTKDPLARCDCNPPYSAENAISCRSDLNPPNGTYPFEALGH